MLHASARKVDSLHNKVDFILYTDASCDLNYSGSSENNNNLDIASESDAFIGRIGAVIVNKDYHDGGFDGVFGSAMPWGRGATDVCGIPNDTSVIGDLEQVAAVLSLFGMRYSIEGRTVLFFADNASLCALEKVSPHHLIVDRYIALFWHTAALFNISV